MKRIKISSGDLTFTDLVVCAGKTGLPILLSTGMSTESEIHRARMQIVHPYVTLLHCTSSYPCPYDEVNLRAMPMGQDFGYSDHTLGIAVPIAAVALGASVIEKHFTLDRKAPGPDNHMSTEPKEFAAMVSGIRQVEKALGDSTKKMQPSELELKAKVRRVNSLRP